jgi:hypothetical protein
MISLFILCCVKVYGFFIESIFNQYSEISSIGQEANIVKAAYHPLLSSFIVMVVVGYSKIAEHPPRSNTFSGKQARKCLRHYYKR